MGYDYLESCLLIIYMSVVLVKGSPLNDFIQHYEPITFNSNHLLDQHRRTKRDSFHIIRFDLQIFDKQFTVRLSPNTDLFTKHTFIQTSAGSYDYDKSRIYEGDIQDQENTRVHGIITNNGHFEGRISVSNETFIVEPASRYFKEKTEFHSVLYKVSDVVFNRAAYSDRTNLHDVLKAQSTQSSNVYRKTGLNNFHQNIRRKRVIEEPKTTCELYIKADHHFYEEHGGTPELVINQIVQYVQTVNGIYSAIDFNNNGLSDNIRFGIKKIKMYTNISDPDYSRYLGNFDVVKFLELHSAEDYDQFCLSYVLTHRDFGDGVLGLAWTASQIESQAGGLCERYREINGKYRSLNAGVVTTLNYGQTVPTAVNHLTLAHEIGHNMGSDHDPENITCAPGGSVGNYIMFPKATSGEKTNNQMFSACSIQQMASIISTKGSGISGCFTVASGSICGNKVIDSGEQCDCGWEAECQEICCNPQGSASTPCTLKSNATCSPSHGSCCSENCQLVPIDMNQVCQHKTSCQLEAVCDSDNYQASCPKPKNVPDKTLCDESRVCVNGECSGSICLAYDYEACQCKPVMEGDWRDTSLCSVCCKIDGLCKSSYNIFNMPNSTMVSGSPCFDDKGYCDVFKKCREVDPSGFYDDLSKWITNSGEQIASWLTGNWWAAALIAFGVLVLLAVFIKVCSKSPSEKQRTRIQQQPADNQLRQQPGVFRMQQSQQRRHPPNRVAPVFTTQAQQHHY